MHDPRLSVGQNLTTDFVGCGVFIYGDHGAPVYSNANGWRVENLLVYGCRHGLKLQGADGNAGKCEQLLVQSSLSWAVLDMSFLGNEYSSPTMAGGSGILTLDNSSCACTITGAYNEEGTASHFGVSTLALGGTLGSDLGGYSWIRGLFNRIQIGDAGGDGSIFSHQVLAYPTDHFFNFATQKALTEGTATGLTFRMSKPPPKASPGTLNGSMTAAVARSFPWSPTRTPG